MRHELCCASWYSPSWDTPGHYANQYLPFLQSCGRWNGPSGYWIIALSVATIIWSMLGATYSHWEKTFQNESNVWPAIGICVVAFLPFFWPIIPVVAVPATVVLLVNWIRRRVGIRLRRNSEKEEQRKVDEYSVDCCLADEMWQGLEEDSNLTLPLMRQLVVAAFPSQESRFANASLINDAERQIARQAIADKLAITEKIRNDAMTKQAVWKASRRVHLNQK